MRRRHASHITVVLSKAAHSGPSVCLRARAPCPLRVSCPGADCALCVQQACRRKRAVRAAGLALPWPLGCKTGSLPDVQLTHGPGRTVALQFLLRSTLHFSADRTDTSVFVREYYGVSRRVRTVSFVDDFVVLARLLNLVPINHTISLTCLHFLPNFVSF